MADLKKSPASGQSGGAGESEWRHFPELEKLFSSEESAASVMAQIEKTCRRLDELIRTGSSAEQARAKAAMAAYGRALDLVHQIRERREQAAAQAK